MPKRPPEIFEYGELSRTRKNIGEVSEEEARKLREKLGGQVGVEKPPPEVDKKYQELREKTLERNARGFIDNPSPVGHRTNKEKISPAVMRFHSRWALDWYLTHYAYRAKSVWQALSNLWNRKGPDRPRRDWILETDLRWFRSLENLVLAVRGMTSRQHKNALQSLRRIPLFYNILRILREWDVEAIGRELEILQKTPQQLTFVRLGHLAQLVMRPFILLERLDPAAHLQAALVKMYDLSRMYLTTEKDLERLRKYYVVARDELPLIFPRLKTHLYPVLIKLLGNDFLEEEAFYSKHRTQILEFLDVPDQEILHPDQVKKADPIRRDKVPEPIEEPLSRPEKHKVENPGKLAAYGRDVLEKLFPESGFTKEEGADFWAYFSPLFNFPRGAELIDPSDPLAKVLTLIILVDQFFFGTENFRLNPAFNPTGSTLSPRKQLDQLSQEWRRAINEIITRRYLNELTEYCRALEQGSLESPVVRRQEELLFWIRKNGILPHEPVPIFHEVRPQPLGAIPFFNLIADLNQFLIALAVDTERALKAPSQSPTAFINPLEMFRFDIDSALSRRLHSYFRKVIRLDSRIDPYLDNRTNRTFLFVTLAVVQYLDYLVNNPASPANRVIETFHRRLGPQDPRPVYGVQQKPSPEILVRANHQEAMNQKNNHNLPVEDDLADFYSPWLFKDKLKHILAAHDYHGEEGGVAVFQLFLGKDIERENLNLKLQDELAETFPDRPLNRKGSEFQMIFTLPTNSALAQIKDFLARCSRLGLPLHVVWVGLHRSINTERIFQLAQRGLHECTEYPPQVLGVYDHQAGVFQFADDLPLCESQSTYEEDEIDVDEEANPDADT